MSTFYLRPPTGERWTARAGQQLVGRAVRYGRLGRVGVVERTVVVSSGRLLRLHVALTRKLTDPERRKFSLAPEAKA